jgi:hypothetical protein
MLIAVMLGLLKMSVAECITAYLSLSDRVFRKTRHWVTIKGRVQGRFDSEELARAVKEVVKQRGLQEDALLKDVPDARFKEQVRRVLLPKNMLMTTAFCAQQARRRATQSASRATARHGVTATSLIASKYGRPVEPPRRLPLSSAQSQWADMAKSSWTGRQVQTTQCERCGTRHRRHRG